MTPMTKRRMSQSPCPGVEQHGRRSLGQRPARQARSQPRDRPEEQRQEALRARNSAEDHVSRLA
jgi:hypothetical protein